ncbi:sulfotransferase family protein [Paludisphaera rhizosphaerae]|uniref:sulfotransferase family protein n=1 Tax=Paludisphaera rhizosphaerae TaxID=2711216 RepID=UPI0013EAEE78|nr:sulfotransferase [Paludisphaera rhizosphaerae]
MSENSPLFVVGAPRSGTTLLAAMLSAHPRIQGGQETHFFNRLARTSTLELLDPRCWPGPATAFLASNLTLGRPVHEAFGLTLEEVRGYLASREPSIAAMLESLTRVNAQREGKPRWLEKTPNHLLHLQDLRRAFPDAYVLRIVRDPRDVALSMCRVPWGSLSPLANISLWQNWDNASWRFFEADPRSMTIRFEELVTDPEGTLRAVCTQIGEEFDPGMLDTAESAKALVSPIEWWKADAGKPIDRTRLGTWERLFPTEELRAAEFLCSDGLSRYDYAVTRGAPLGVLTVVPMSRELVEAHRDVILRLADRGVALRSLSHDIWDLNWAESEGRECLVFWGVPFPGHSRAERLASIARLARLLIRRSLSGKRSLCWPVGFGRISGKSEGLSRLLIRLCCREVALEAMR